MKRKDTKEPKNIEQNLLFARWWFVLFAILLAGCKMYRNQAFVEPSEYDLQGLKDKYYRLVLLEVEGDSERLNFLVCHQKKVEESRETNVQIFLGMDPMQLCVVAFVDDEGKPINFAKGSFVLEKKRAMDAYYDWVKQRLASQASGKEIIGQTYEDKQARNDLGLALAAGGTVLATTFFAYLPHPKGFLLAPLALVFAPFVHSTLQESAKKAYGRDLLSFADCDRALKKGMVSNTHVDHQAIQKACNVVGVQLPLSRQSLALANLQLEDVMNLLDMQHIHQTSLRIPHVVSGLAKLMAASGWGDELSRGIQYHCLPSENFTSYGPDSMCLPIEASWSTGDETEYLKPKERKPAEL